VDWFLRGMIEVERKHLVDLGVMEFWSSGVLEFWSCGVWSWK
jgi:hypothetical protein